MELNTWAPANWLSRREAPVERCWESRSEERRVGSDWSSDVCSTDLVDGRRTAENLFLLNGIEYMGASQLAVTPGGASGELLGIDAIREFNVLTDTYGAEYGKRAGAQ